MIQLFFVMTAKEKKNNAYVTLQLLVVNWRIELKMFFFLERIKTKYVLLLMTFILFTLSIIDSSVGYRIQS
jgi:hypothetical protein